MVSNPVAMLGHVAIKMTKERRVKSNEAFVYLCRPSSTR